MEQSFVPCMRFAWHSDKLVWRGTSHYKKMDFRAQLSLHSALKVLKFLEPPLAFAFWYLWTRYQSPAGHLLPWILFVLLLLKLYQTVLCSLNEVGYFHWVLLKELQWQKHVFSCMVVELVRKSVHIIRFRGTQEVLCLCMYCQYLHMTVSTKKFISKAEICNFIKRLLN